MLVGEVGGRHQLLMERMEGKAQQQEKILQLPSDGTHKNFEGRLPSSRASGRASVMLYESLTKGTKGK